MLDTVRERLLSPLAVLMEGDFSDSDVAEENLREDVIKSVECLLLEQEAFDAYVCAFEKQLKTLGERWPLEEEEIVAIFYRGLAVLSTDRLFALVRNPFGLKRLSSTILDSVDRITIYEACPQLIDDVDTKEYVEDSFVWLGAAYCVKQRLYHDDWTWQIESDDYATTESTAEGHSN